MIQDSSTRRLRRRRLPLIALSCALLPVSAGGCAYYSATALDPDLRASAAASQREVDGLYVAVESLVAARDSIALFDRDLPAYGFLPTVLLLEMDQSSEATFDVSRHDLRLALADGTRLETADAKEIAEAVGYSYWRATFGFIPLIIPGFFVASSVGEANDALLYDYDDKGLESVRLSPNSRSYRGVVFFRVPEERVGEVDLEDAFLEVKIYRRGRSGELDRVFDLPVHFDG